MRKSNSFSVNRFLGDEHSISSGSAERSARYLRWYDSIDNEITSRILDDIYSSLDQLSRFPMSGMSVNDGTFRRLVTTRYRFKIAYEIMGDAIIVLGIFRYQDRVR